MKLFWRELIKQGKTAKWLAKSVGVSSQTVYDWKNGVMKPRIRHFIKIAQLLKIDIDKLIKDFE